jgi:putative nucleotidyltransferase with HDIG domain
MHERKQTMRSAIFIGLFYFGTNIILKLLIGTPVNMTIFTESALVLIVAMLAVFLAIGSLPLWEAIFGFITPLQLLELTNPNQPILKRLLIEATGTYYHSLLVANLAEAAADAIGANPLMARVGGYYHDIGKIKNPNLFKENQIGENPHDRLTPEDSFLLISSHVSYGLELSEQYKLPKYIKDIIVQHHGTSLMQYFYSKAVKLQGEDVDKEKYSYNGSKPKTKEAALVMLADIVEATTRSLQEKIGTEIILEELVGKLVRQKLEEGQLDECYLYIADINKIIDTFSKVLRGMYHQRVKYPERNEK